MKDLYPPVPPPFRMITSSGLVLTNQPNAALLPSAGPRVSRCVFNSRSDARRSGVSVCAEETASRNVRRSFAVDRNPPAPVNVGISQFEVGSRLWLWPGVSRSRIEPESVTPVLSMPNGAQIRSITNSS